jgi:hypothetical protein
MVLTAHVAHVQRQESSTHLVGSFPAVVVGLALAAFLGLGVLVTGILWLERRFSSPVPVGAG